MKRLLPTLFAVLFLGIAPVQAQDATLAAISGLTTACDASDAENFDEAACMAAAGGLPGAVQEDAGELLPMECLENALACLPQDCPSGFPPTPPCVPGPQNLPTVPPNCPPGYPPANNCIPGAGNAPSCDRSSEDPVVMVACLPNLLTDAVMENAFPLPALPGSPSSLLLDGDFEGPAGEPYATFQSAARTTDAAFSGLASIEMTSVDPGSDIYHEDILSHGYVAARAKPGVLLGDLGSVSVAYSRPVGDAATVKFNHYITFDTNGDGDRDGCISAPYVNNVGAQAVWQIKVWGPDASYKVNNWQNCESDAMGRSTTHPDYDDDDGLGFASDAANAPLAQLVVEHPSWILRSITLQALLTSGDDETLSATPLYIDALVASGKSRPVLPLHAGDGFVASIVPANALRGDLVTVQEPNLAGRYVYQVCGFDAAGVERDFTDWRMEFWSIDPARAQAADPVLLAAVGSYGPITTSAPANDGDNCVVVQAPASVRGASLNNQLVQLAFWVPYAPAGQVSLYSEVANAQLAQNQFASADLMDRFGQGVYLVPYRGNFLGSGDLTLGSATSDPPNGILGFVGQVLESVLGLAPIPGVPAACDPLAEGEPASGACIEALSEGAIPAACIDAPSPANCGATPPPTCGPDQVPGVDGCVPGVPPVPPTPPTCAGEQTPIVDGCVPSPGPVPNPLDLLPFP